MSGSGGKTIPAQPEGHGGVRGDAALPRSAMFEGRFGRMFRGLPPAVWPEEALRKLGLEMIAEPERDEVNRDLPKAAAEDPAKTLQDEEENAGIPSGYTYLGQFIDHDITYDPASSLQKQNDPDALVDFRTPRLDLDNLYGRGPADQPYMFIGNKFRLGAALMELDQASKRRDLPRYNDLDDPTGPKRALIGDKRNDENVIVSQLQSTMLQFHNKLVDLFPAESFEDIQQRVRWHYQWIVANDFLVKICGQAIVDQILPHRLEKRPSAEKEPKLQFYKYRNDAFMPVEFSAAAYRFGHSMVRPIYRLNTQLNGGADPDAADADEIRRGLAGRFFIFAGVQRRGLNGFDAFPRQWAIDWSLFFDIDGSGAKGGKERAQPSYKIDTSLVNPLGFLPEFSKVVPPAPPLTIEQLQAKPESPVLDPAILATRNLLRGMAMRLPSGQDVADFMGLECVPDEDLRIGKATIADHPKNPTVMSIDPCFKGSTPLWCYILAEAQAEWYDRATAPGGKRDAEPMTLGSVGQRIVAETLIGLLAADNSSYLRQCPNWEPVIDGARLDTMGKLIKFIDS